MNTYTMVPALIGIVSTIALLYAIRLIILSRSAINISGAILLITMSCALIGYLFQLVINDLASVLFWQKIQVLGINFMYPAWLIFILLLTGNRRLICWRLLVLLFVVSLFPNVVLNAPSIRNWFVITKGLVEIGPFNGLNQDLGWVVWFSTSIATIQCIVGSLILFNQRKKLRSSYKPHFYLLLLLPFVPFIAIWVEISGSNPIAPLSIFNLSLIPVCGIVTYVIYILRIGEEHNRLKENVVDSMHSAVLILDSMDRVQYANPAAGKLFELPIESTKNKPLASILPALSEYLTKTSSQNDGVELTTLKDFVFDIKVNTTEDWRGEPVTKMIVLTNITEIDQLETTILDRNREITHKNTLLSGLAEVNLYFQSTNKLEDMFGVLDNVFSNIGLSFFISTFEPVSNDLVVNYLTADDTAVKRIEGLLGSKVTGYHIPEKHFPQMYNFMNGSIAEQSYSSTMLLTDENLHPVVRESIRLVGIDLNLPMFLLQLKAATKPIGFLGVWGNLLEDKDFPTLRIFANQMALAIERHQLYQNEINQSTELARSNKLITALVNVATLMGSSGDYTESLRTLGQELEELHLHCILGILDEKAETIVFKYSSFTPGVLKLITKLTKINFTGYELRKKYWPGTKVMSEGVPVWYGNPLGIFQKMFPQLPDSVFSKIMKMMEITDGQNLCILPLIIKGKVAGVFPVWGEGITEKDTTTLTVFAYQVGEILARMKEYENEQNRANRLARSNAILIALSRVASRLETNSDLNEIYKTLGTELKSVNIECMVGTLDEKKENLTIEYLSISSVIFDYARSHNLKWPGQIRVPRSLWPTDTAIKDKEPYWDANPVASVSKMFPYVPQKIMAQSFKAMGMPEVFHMCYLPIIVNDNVIGIMSVWGPDLQEEDIPGLMVFSNQVSTSINNAKLYDQAQKEIIIRTEAENKIQEALTEKEVLLKEVHHRVKNNLQIISSLLNLQMGQSTDPVLVEGLRESQSRVRAMALIHEKLYQSEDLTRIKISSYISSLTNALITSYRMAPGKVEVLVDARNIYFDLETAIPCGLIVNELVSNSLKYAFPGDKNGTVQVSINEPQKGNYILIVKDDGVGLPKSLNPEKESSLGLKLVSSLVRQIEGEMRVANEIGVRYEINFSIAKN